MVEKTKEWGKAWAQSAGDNYDDARLDVAVARLRAMPYGPTRDMAFKAVIKYIESIIK